MHNSSRSDDLVQVFIHDPLYKWALTTSAVEKRQRDVGSDDGTPGAATRDPNFTAEAGAGNVTNADAERALLRVRSKLEGVENGGLHS